MPDESAHAPFYAQVILTVQDHAPLLAAPRLARLTLTTLRAITPPGRWWGCVVLPDMLRWIAGPVASEADLERLIATIRARTEAALLPVIRAAEDDSLDAVLRYSPVWGGAIYHVWAPGCHRQRYWTEYKLSNALYELRQAPVEAGLVDDPAAWPFLWLASDDEA